jgi:hypothetical protein
MAGIDGVAEMARALARRGSTDTPSASARQSAPAMRAFMHDDLGYFDPDRKTLQPLDNPFGTRLSLMS